MAEDIFFWTRHDAHGYCSNFWRAPIEMDGKVYPTTEHYFQAMKTLIPEQQEMLRTLKKPLDAKLAGYHVTLRRGWDDVWRDEVMLTALRAKFTQHPDLKEKLLSTGYAILHEDSPWDKYWGYAKGKGQDRLGVLLMKVREELRNG